MLAKTGSRCVARQIDIQRVSSARAVDRRRGRAHAVAVELFELCNELGREIPKVLAMDEGSRNLKMKIFTLARQQAIAVCTSEGESRSTCDEEAEEESDGAFEQNGGDLGEQTMVQTTFLGAGYHMHATGLALRCDQHIRIRTVTDMVHNGSCCGKGEETHR